MSHGRIQGILRILLRLLRRETRVLRVSIFSSSGMRRRAIARLRTEFRPARRGRCARSNEDSLFLRKVAKFEHCDIRTNTDQRAYNDY